LTQTLPLPAGGAGWLVLVFGAEALPDLAGFVEAAEFEDAGGFELAGAGAAAPEFELEGVDAAADVSAALVDFDFFVLADFVPAFASFDAASSVDAALADLDFVLVDFAPESASFDAAESVDEVLGDFDFFELVDFVPAAESVEAVESAFASVEEAFADFFLELAAFSPDAESADAASPDEAFADLDFFELVEAVEPPEESLSEVDFAFFDFDVEDFPEEDASLESVELASVDFFFDLVVFFAGVVLESLESVACAFTGATLASASPSPAEIKNANTYFLNRFMLFPPQFAHVRRTPKRGVPRRAFTRAFCASPAGARLQRYEFDELAQLVPPKDLRASAQIRLAAYRVAPLWLKPQRFVERPLRLEWSQRDGSLMRAVRTVPGETTLSDPSRFGLERILMLAG